jgi:hypothetical protein
MEDIGVLWHCPVSLLRQSCASHVLVIIVSNMVEFLLEDITKSCPNGLYPKCCRLISVMALLLTFPPTFDMGKGLKSANVIFFYVQQILNRVITL